MHKETNMTWHKNSEGRYGEKGAKGDAGEEFVKQYCIEKGHKFIHVTDSKNQRSGIDFFINDIPIDVKTNIKDKRLTVEIKKKNKIGWLYTSKAKFIFGVDLALKEIYVYNLEKMRKHVEENISKSYEHDNDILIKIPVFHNFIKRLL